MPPKSKDNDANNVVEETVIAKMEAMFPSGRSFEPREPSTKQLSEKIDALKHKVELVESRQPSTEQIRRSRFGFSMMLIGIITMIGGMYPLPTDQFNRIFLMVAGLFCAVIGAWNVKRANDELGRPRKPPSDSE